MSSRSLRVGVLLGDSLVEERVFPAGRPITIGQSLKCDLSLPVDGVPHEHVLFAADEGRMLLRVTDKMIGRIAQGSTIRTELVGAIPIEQGARGRIQIGAATVLFQDVASVPKAPRPQLPSSVRGTLGDRIDRRLGVVIAGSIALHLGVAVWAWAIDREVVQPPHEDPEVAIAQETYTLTLPDDPEPVPGVATPVVDGQTPSPIVPKIVKRPKVSQPGMPEPDAEYLAKILTGDVAGKHGKPGMPNTRPGADLDKQIQHIRDHQGEVGTDRDTGFREPTDVRPGTVDGPKIESPTNGFDETKVDKEPLKPRIEIEPKKRPTGTTLSVDEVLAKIQSSYMSGLQRCYKKGLAGDAQLSGTVDVTFTVSADGSVTDESADGVEDRVDSCIQSQMSAWRFPIPKAKDGTAKPASFALSLALTSS